MSEIEDHEITVVVVEDYRPLLEDKLADLLPSFENNDVVFNPIRVLKSPEMAQIVIGIGGAVGVEIVKQIFMIVRQIIKDSHGSQKSKPARAAFSHGGKHRVIETGDEDV